MRRIHFDVTDSTNTEARRLAAKHSGECLLVTATKQSAGRGRHGRAWESPLGGAWMSIVWPSRQPPQAYGAVSLLAAIAVRRALLEVVETARLSIKWPNDVLIDDQKVCGILCEQWPGENGQAGVLVIGIGVNVDFDHGLFPPNVRHPATTLASALGRAIPVEDVIDAVSEQVVAALEDFESVGFNSDFVDELRSCLAYVGDERSWQSPRGEITGKVVGIDDTGRLLLEVDSHNGKRTLTAHDVGEFAPTQA